MDQTVRKGEHMVFLVSGIAKRCWIGFSQRRDGHGLSHIRSCLLACYAVLSTSVGLSADISPKSPTVEVIAMIEANEKLYQSLEVVTRILNQFQNSNDMSVEVTNCEWWHSIVHGDCFFVFRNESVPSTEDPFSQRHFRKAGFDGTTGWTIDDLGNATLRHAESTHEVLPRPHNFFLCRKWVQGSLSKFLLSHQEDLQYQGESVADGIRCKILSFRAGNVVRLWVAPSRNYIPVCVEVVDSDKEDERRVLFGVASDWSEIAPNVWFPFYSRTIEHETITADQSMTRITEYFVDKAVLHPQRRVEFPPFANGTRVEVYREGKRLHGYVQGELTKRTEPLSTFMRMLIVNDLLIVTFLAWWLIRMAKRSFRRNPA